jgi:type I restriction enzyme S subunit
MTQQNKNVPVLRFPEFSEGWEEKQYGTIFSFKITNSFSRENLNYESGNVKNIHYGDIHTKFNTLFDITKEYVPFINYEIKLNKIADENYCKEGDLVIADASEDYADVGKCIEITNLNNEKVLAGLHTFLARPDLFKMTIGFSGYLMKSPKLRLQIMTIAQGTKVLSISTGRLSKITLNIPKEPEQQKIAAFLTAVGEKIQQLTRKKGLLEQYKKGVIQRIFDQEIRFKDKNGNNFADWEEASLGYVLKERNTYLTKGDGLEHISLTIAGVVPKSARYERDFLVSAGEDKSYKITRLNDICYNPANLKFGVISRNKYGDGIFSPIYITFEVQEQDIEFVEYLVTRKDFINKARKYEEGTVYERMAVKPSDLLRMTVKLPSRSEQQKIANFLSAIDDKIKLVNQQLEKTQTFKKGLLQQMFI